MDREPDIISAFHPAVKSWFCQQFQSLTESQKLAFPAIKKGENILLFSPTGSGKTLAGFLVSIDYLVQLAEKNQLENSVYVIYVSPLRALSNDIKKNLMIPLEGIQSEAPFAHIRAFVRTGDTSAYRKSKMIRKTPHILITTPETLQIVLNAPKFKEKLTTVQYVIIDEIHDLCSTKRGVSLSLSLERLHYLAGPFVRIGLSATQAPVDKIAQFLVGSNRHVQILTAERHKKYDLTIVKPESLSSLSLEKAVEETYDILKDLIEAHTVTLVFSNTRSRTERIVYQLKNRGLYSVAAHHGSMGKETRHEIEHLLKKGSIKAVITSTSLELGIDIGDVDLIVQLGTPKHTAKLMQRVGRAGRGSDAVSKGVLIAQDRDELVELEILRKKALAYNLEPVQIPENCLDVLAQHLIGMSLEKVWDAEEAFQVIRKSYCYRSLKFNKFIKVLEYLGGYYADLEDKHIYRKIWFNQNRFGRVKASLYLYFPNCGTIPSEASFLVVLDNIPLGKLSEHFVSHLKPKDIFVLGGRSLEVLRIEGMRVVVKDALGGKPTVPSWRGEAMSRAYEFAADLSQFRKDAAAHGCADPDIDAYIDEQKKGAGFIPTAETLYVERYIDEQVYRLIFHFPFGRRVNETLARAYGQKLRCQDFTVTDNGFMLTAHRALNFRRDMVKSAELFDILKGSVWGTELFCQRFRHCAQRGFLILKTYKGKSITPRTQYFRARALLQELPYDFPLVEEAFNEVLYTALDYRNAQKVLQDIEKKVIDVVVSDYTSIPSPFALSIILAGAQDIITLKDRSEFLQHMQRAVTERIIEAAPAFDPDIVNEYFSGRTVNRVQGSPEEVILDILRCSIKTAQELADTMQVTVQEVEQILDGLIEENLVSCGYFTAPFLQYMLIKDRRRLEYGEGIEEPVLKKYVMEKHFTYTDIEDVFSSYGAVRSTRSLYDRVGFFSQELLKVKVAGRLGYILPEDAPLFASAYREEPLNQELMHVLDYIRDHPGMKRKEIIHACGSDVTTLEDNLYVYRDDENQFYILDVDTYNKGKAQKEIVRRFVASCGPVTIEEILYHTRFQEEELDTIIEEFTKVTVFSRIVQEMYCTHEDYERLGKASQNRTVRIIHPSDPFYSKILYNQEIQEGGYPIVVDGQAVGGILYEAGDTFCIEDVHCTDALSPEELFSELQRVYQFYRWHGARSLVITAEPLKKMAEDLGYTVQDGILIDAPLFKKSLQEVHFTQLEHQCLVDEAPAEQVLQLPFLDYEAAHKRCPSVKEMIESGSIVEVSYQDTWYVCLPEDKILYESNNIEELVKRLLNSFLIVSPFQVQTLVKAELFEIERILDSISKKVYYQGELHYMVETDFHTPDDVNILFVSATDPYIVFHQWAVEGTAILINGIPAGYYTTEDNQADLTLYKEFKDLWGNILVRLPSETIRTINGKPIKDTRFARAFF
jgi:Lhr-like helicase